jgi:hypothetical protein
VKAVSVNAIVYRNTAGGLPVCDKFADQTDVIVDKKMTLEEGVTSKAL